eukprot:CAMPEP_0114501100 /NCGR_PEP_ID=MMETSP0109-20121206/8319_1 /TAXON_ID=29199 /ORGANISM="Chlorarachnion reptans, Strain CCCM449" /LENGTH=44 /DNA_ID= /DNA_START= /DNA_END= /DNA_ORIENTATION=
MALMGWATHVSQSCIQREAMTSFGAILKVQPCSDYLLKLGGMKA